MTTNEFLSLKKVSSANIDGLIVKKEEEIRAYLPDVFTDVATAELAGHSLIRLALMKDARLLMSTVSYKVYEKEGKNMRYEEFLSEWGG